MRQEDDGHGPAMLGSPPGLTAESSMGPAVSVVTAGSLEVGLEGRMSVSSLQRRCRRLARERDEARAESFAQASVAVQRGIEIDNLSEFESTSIEFEYIKFHKAGNCESS